jgi:hypothetical protein
MDWSEAVPYPHHAPHRRRLARVFLHRLMPVPVKAERSEPGKIFVSSGGSMLVIFVLQWVNFICTKWVNSIDNQHSPGALLCLE